MLIELKNSYEILEKVAEPFFPIPSEVVVVVDSQVRYMGKRLARTNRVACFPGARIATIADRLGLDGAKSD